MIMFVLFNLHAFIILTFIFLGLWMWQEHASQRPERTSDAAGASDSTQEQPEHGSTQFQSNRPPSAFGIPTAISLGTLQPPVSIKFSICFINLWS